MATAQSISRLLATKFQRSRTIQHRITSESTYGYKVRKNYNGQILIACYEGRRHEAEFSKPTTIGLVAEFLEANGYTVQVKPNDFYPITIN